jgi:hypothetical protein
MATQSHNYQGTLVRTAHRTIYVESSRECSKEELQQWMTHMADNDIDVYSPETGIEITIGSEYHSEQTAEPD